MKVLVTGAAMGIGAAVARRLAQGNELVLHYYSSESDAIALASELQGVARSVTLVAADLTTPAGCEELARAVKLKWDALDVLVNNAGGMVRRERLGELTWETTLKTFALNTFSTMALTSSLADWLRRGTDACVVNVTSIAMRHGAPTATAYGASKAAVDSFTRGAARELAPDVRVNAVAPGIVDTRFHERVSTADQMETWRGNTLVRRHGQPEEIAEAVAFLVNSKFTTGECLDINGGLSTR